MTKQSTTETKKPETREEEHERRSREGRLSFLSPRNPFKYRAHETFKFIPSREQH
jgi:hypothetical protein